MLHHHLALLLQPTAENCESAKSGLMFSSSCVTYFAIRSVSHEASDTVICSFSLSEVAVRVSLVHSPGLRLNHLPKAHSLDSPVDGECDSFGHGHRLAHFKANKLACPCQIVGSHVSIASRKVFQLCQASSSRSWNEFKVLVQSDTESTRVL